MRWQLAFPTLRQGFGFAQCQGLPFALAGVDCEMLSYSEANRRSAPDLASDVLDIAFSTYVDHIQLPILRRYIAAVLQGSFIDQSFASDCR